VQAIAAQKGLRNPVIDATVALVDARLEPTGRRLPPDGGLVSPAGDRAGRAPGAYASGAGISRPVAARAGL